jgi:NAD(P)H-flavin reductase
VALGAPNHLLWLDISMPLQWTIQPGQYVQLWLPGAGMRARLQLLLFYVAVWEEDATERRRRIHMVAQPRSGLTSRLHQAAASRAASTKGLREQANIDQVTLNPQSLDSVVRQPVVVLGPYGRAHDFSRFGTVLFVVEDVGFFRALLYIGRLVEASRRHQSMVRKLEIIWQAGVFSTSAARHGRPEQHADLARQTIRSGWRAGSNECSS